MKIAWITGTSRGLGKALAEQFLQEGWMVHGIGRNHTIEHENYSTCRVDLCKELDVNAFRFNIPMTASEALYIHNAAVLGEIAYSGSYPNGSALSDVFQVNLVSAAVLSNAFVAEVSKRSLEAGLMFISSGAARNPYDGWSAYCSSKAGLDMLARCIAEEQRIEQRSLLVYSVAPGVIDTGMQEQIRQAQHSAFSKVDRFLMLKHENKLDAPEKTAARLYRLWDYRAHVKDVCIDLREVELD